MAADTALKRYSAMNIGSPWRGLNVVPNVAIPQGERQAVLFMYSGILAGASEPEPEPGAGNPYIPVYRPRRRVWLLPLLLEGFRELWKG